MKLIQINGWLGRLNGPLKRFIVQENPDLVCMQEAFSPETKSLKVFSDQYGYTKEIIRGAGFTHHFFAASSGFEMANKVIDSGNIIMSKYPILNPESFPIHGDYIVKNFEQQGDNIRRLLTCKVSLPNDKTLSLVNYQGYLTGPNPLGDEITEATMQKVLEILKTLPKPLIFCGDLNVTPESEPIKIIESSGLINLTRNYSVKTTLSSVHRAPDKDRGSVACDYIFVSNDITVDKFQVSEELVSDHKALVLEFDL